MTAATHSLSAPNRVKAGSHWRKLSLPGRTGLFMVIAFGLLALGVALGWAGTGWSDMIGERWEAPSGEHWLGTNLLGQDILARAVYSTLTAFQVGVLVAAAATLLGALFGALAGWLERRWTDELILWVMGVLDSIPFYLLVAAIAFAMRNNPWSMHLAMVLTFWTGTARLVRGEVLRLREREFVQAARALGLPTYRILARHILPNTAHILLVQATLSFVAAIKTEVVLSFLGLGLHDGVSWGVMLAESTQEVLAGQFGNFLAASGFLFTLLLAFNLLADALQDHYELRGQSA